MKVSKIMFRVVYSSSSGYSIFEPKGEIVFSVKKNHVELLNENEI